SELKKSSDPNKNGAAKVGVTTTKRLVKAACEIFDKYHDIKDAIGKETEGDMLVKATDWIILALDVLSLAYDIVETIVVVHLHKNPAEKYKNRVKQAGYMSPQDWVKFSFFMLKTTLATIAAIDKNIVYYSSMANNKGSISVTPKKITIEAPDVETKDKTSSSNAGPLMGTNAPAVNTGSNVRPVVSGGNVSGGSSSAP
ncbi:MAG: hypothetical protein ACI4M9_05510, partial [Succinivibrio sp.]